MALPWGGLYDIGQNWNPPHRTHDDGTRVDMGGDSTITRVIRVDSTRTITIEERGHFRLEQWVIDTLIPELERTLRVDVRGGYEYYNGDSTQPRHHYHYRVVPR